MPPTQSPPTSSSSPERPPRLKPRWSFGPLGLSLAGHDRIRRFWLARFKSADVAQRDMGDFRERLTGQKSLVAGDDDIREGRQALKNVVLDDRGGVIREEDRALTLVNIHREIGQPVLLIPRHASRSTAYLAMPAS